MDKKLFKTTLEKYQNMIEKEISGIILEENNLLQKKIFTSMRYSLLAGGKRIRPILTLAFCETLSGEIEKALPLAIALELIHTYSLIHDDLPCMDNDDLRRGKPTNHIVFGEATAVLTGDALLNMAYEMIFSEKTVLTIGYEKAVNIGRIISTASGAYGMIGGQIIDMESEEKKLSTEEIKLLNSLKTGSLIVAAAKTGCIVANASQSQINAACEYAKCIGQAFQIRDDILNVTSTKKQMGKSIGSDFDNKKSNYVTVFGLEKAYKIAEELTFKAKESVNILGDSEFLKKLADMLCERVK